MMADDKPVDFDVLTFIVVEGGETRFSNGFHDVCLEEALEMTFGRVMRVTVEVIEHAVMQ